MGYMLVTNDFPPKVGGIQSYLYELFRRLPAQELTVLTSAHSGAADFDRQQPFRIERARSPVLLPTPGLGRTIRQLSQATGGGIVLLDPALPLGLLGSRLQLRYGVLLHGAEVTVPADYRSRASSCGPCCVGHRSRSRRAVIQQRRRRAPLGRESRELSSCLPGSTTSGSIQSTPTSGWPSDAGSGCPPRAGSSSA